MAQPIKHIRPDMKGRIHLGKLAEGISGFTVTIDKHHRIILEPMVEIPLREKWLLENKSAFKQVLQGLKEVDEGKLHDLGSFAKYLDEDIDE